MKACVHDIIVFHYAPFHTHSTLCADSHLETCAWTMSSGSACTCIGNISACICTCIFKYAASTLCILFSPSFFKHVPIRIRRCTRRPRMKSHAFQLTEQLVQILDALDVACIRANTSRGNGLSQVNIWYQHSSMAWLKKMADFGSLNREKSMLCRDHIRFVHVGISLTTGCHALRLDFDIPGCSSKIRSDRIGESDRKIPQRAMDSWTPATRRGKISVNVAGERDSRPGAAHVPRGEKMASKPETQMHTWRSYAVCRSNAKAKAASPP
jgi:hypothetical protein